MTVKRAATPRAQDLTGTGGGGRNHVEASAASGRRVAACGDIFQNPTVETLLANSKTLHYNIPAVCEELREKKGIFALSPHPILLVASYAYSALS
jgi:hypothetical protein